MILHISIAFQRKDFKDNRQANRHTIAGGICTDSIRAGGIRTGGIYTGSFCTGGIYADSIRAGSICAGGIYTGSFCTGGIYADSIRAGSICTDSICTDGICAGNAKKQPEQAERPALPFRLLFCLTAFIRPNYGTHPAHHHLHRANPASSGAGGYPSPLSA